MFRTGVINMSDNIVMNYTIDIDQAINKTFIIYEECLDLIRSEAAIKPYYIFITNNMTLIYILLALITLMLCALLVIISKLYGAKRLKLPGPLHFPIVGSLYEFVKNKHRFYNWMLDCAKKYGKNGAFYFSIPAKSSYLIVLKPEYLREILYDDIINKTNQFSRKPIYEVCDELLGEGIFNTDGELWKHQRQIGSHGFKTRNLDNAFLSCFQNCTNILIEKINMYAENNLAFDIKDLFFRITMQTICEIAFGYRINTIMVDQIPPFAVAMDKCTRHLFHRILNPLWRIKKNISLPDEVEYKNNVALLDEICYKIIDERIEKIKNNINNEDNTDTTDDILSFYISFLLKQNSNKIDFDEIFTNDTRKYLRDVVFSFLIAGRDTTAATLSWLFFELLTKDDIVSLIEEEIDIVEESHPIHDINYYNKLSTLHGAFYETLRLHPPVPMNVKYATKDLYLGKSVEDAIYVPKNTAVIYSPFIMGRLESIWGDNVNEFDINRNHTSKTSYQFPSFNAGPRICLGKKFATIEAIVISSEILKQFKIVPVNNEIFNKPPQYSLGITSSPNYPIMVKAIKKMNI